MNLKVIAAICRRCDTKLEIEAKLKEWATFYTKEMLAEAWRIKQIQRERALRRCRKWHRPDNGCGLYSGGWDVLKSDVRLRNDWRNHLKPGVIAQEWDRAHEYQSGYESSVSDKIESAWLCVNHWCFKSNAPISPHAYEEVV